MNSDVSKNEVAIETGKASIENKSEKATMKAKKRKQGKHSKRDKTVAEEKGQLAIIDLPGELLERGDTEHLDEGNGGLSSLDLPIELLVKIMEMVPILQWASLELVSHQFKKVMRGMWGQLHEIRLNELVDHKEKKAYQVVDEALRKFFIRAPNVSSISGFAEMFEQLKPLRLETIQLLSKFKHLESIDFLWSLQGIYGGVINLSDFAEFLESFSSRHCSWKRLNIVGDIFDTMKNQPTLKLEYLKFGTRTIRIFDGFLQVDWSRLKKLVVSGFNSPKHILFIIRQCTQLTHLEMEVPQFENKIGQPSCGEFIHGVADLENLFVLKIIGSWSNAEPFFDALPMMIQGLAGRGITDLALVGCYCTDQILDAINEHLLRLRSLELNVIHCTRTASFERLAHKMGQLERLNLPIELLVKIIKMVSMSQWASLELVSHQFKKVVRGMWEQLHEIRLNE